MKQKTLQAALELQQKINTLQCHFNEITATRGHDRHPYEVGSGGQKPHMIISAWFTPSQHGKALQPEFMPVGIKDFMTLYILKVEKRLHELRQEFSDLQDPDE